MAEENPKAKSSAAVGIAVIVIGVVLVYLILQGLAGGPKASQADVPQAEASQGSQLKEDLSKVAREYVLTAGHYEAGVDFPAGTTDATALSGTGNLSSSNLYDGGVNEMFGIDDGSGYYTSSFKYLRLPVKTVLSVSGDLKVKLTFTEVTSNLVKRSYDLAKAVDLASGNYTAGKDFPAGAYNITATSGSGNVSTSNIYDVGINETMAAVADDMYITEFKNADLSPGVTLSVSGGVGLRLVPAR